MTANDPWAGFHNQQITPELDTIRTKHRRIFPLGLVCADRAQQITAIEEYVICSVEAEFGPIDRSPVYKPTAPAPCDWARIIGG
jgi:hypothetical protein